jgi:hypothetical protein
LAELEADLISERTEVAMAAAKTRDARGLIARFCR